MLIERMGEKWRARNEARFADFREARALYEETIGEQPSFAQKDVYDLTEADHEAAKSEPRLIRSELLFREALRISRAEKAWHDVGVACFQLGMLCHLQGRFAEAEAFCGEGLEIADSLPGLDEADVRLISGCCYHLGILAARRGCNEVAERLLKRSLRLDESLPDLSGAALTRRALAHVTGTEETHDGGKA
jgi:hypothetical protein